MGRLGKKSYFCFCMHEQSSHLETCVDLLRVFQQSGNRYKNILTVNTVTFPPLSKQQAICLQLPVFASWWTFFFCFFQIAHHGFMDVGG